MQPCWCSARCSWSPWQDSPRRSTPDRSCVRCTCGTHSYGCSFTCVWWPGPWPTQEKDVRHASKAFDGDQSAAARAARRVHVLPADLELVDDGAAAAVEGVHVSGVPLSTAQ